MATIYKTSDGKTFSNESEARKHQDFIDTGDPQYATSPLDKASAHYDRGEYDSAIANCNFVIDQGLYVPKSEMGRALNTRACSYLKKGNKDKAIADFKECANVLNGMANAQQPLDNLKSCGVDYTPTSSSIYSSSASTPVKDKITYEFGNVYEGYLVDGKRQGKGKMTYPNGDYYEGDWYDDDYHGKGKSLEDGDLYEGDFDLSYFHGKGKMIYADGSVYEGDWFDNYRHGKGKMTYPDGKVEEGDWEDGEFLG